MKSNFSFCVTLSQMTCCVKFIKWNILVVCKVWLLQQKKVFLRYRENVPLVCTHVFWLSIQMALLLRSPRSNCLRNDWDFCSICVEFALSFRYLWSQECVTCIDLFIRCHEFSSLKWFNNGKLIIFAEKDQLACFFTVREKIMATRPAWKNSSADSIQL